MICTTIHLPGGNSTKIYFTYLHKNSISRRNCLKHVPSQHISSSYSLESQQLRVGDQIQCTLYLGMYRQWPWSQFLYFQCQQMTPVPTTNSIWTTETGIRKHLFFINWYREDKERKRNVPPNRNFRFYQIWCWHRKGGTPTPNWLDFNRFGSVGFQLELQHVFFAPPAPLTCLFKICQLDLLNLTYQKKKKKRFVRSAFLIRIIEAR